MEITPSSLDSLNRGFVMSFQRGFEAHMPFWQKLAMETSSDRLEELHGYLDKLPGMREWVGERVYSNIVNGVYTLKNKDFELSVEVERNDIEDDKLGRYAPMFQLIGEQTAKWPDEQVVSALLAGKTSLCHDGQYFFDTDHPKDISGRLSGTQSNLATSTALTAANYAAQRASMMTLVGADGKPLGVRPNTLIVPPALEKTAKEIVVASTVPNAGGTASQTNVQQGTADVLVLDWLSAAAGGSDTDWYLADTGKPIKPLMMQFRKRPAGLVAFDKPTDPNVFEKKKYRYGVDARGAGGYGLWWLIKKCEA